MHEAMLPLLRILPVGGVLLAILLLVLALGAPDTTRTPADRLARGAWLERTLHPEWRQFPIRAALQRADELRRLRELATAALPNADDNAPPPAADTFFQSSSAWNAAQLLAAASRLSCDRR